MRHSPSAMKSMISANDRLNEIESARLFDGRRGLAHQFQTCAVRVCGLQEAIKAMTH